MSQENTENMEIREETVSEQAVTAKAVRDIPSIWLGISWVLLFLGLQIIMSVIAVVILGVLHAMEPGADTASLQTSFTDMKRIAAPLLWALTLSNMVVIGISLLYLRKGARWNRAGLDNWSRISPAATIGIAIGVMAVSYIFNYIYATYIFPDVNIQAVTRDFFAALPDTAGNAVLLFVAVAIVAPIAEELVFRGFLQNSLMQHMPAWGAIGIASIIFGAIHFDPYAFPVLVLMGAAFGYLYHRTGSMRVNIAAHVLNNALAISIPYAMDKFGF